MNSIDIEKIIKEANIENGKEEVEHKQKISEDLNGWLEPTIKSAIKKGRDCFYLREDDYKYVEELENMGFFVCNYDRDAGDCYEHMYAVYFRNADTKIIRVIHSLQPHWWLVSTVMITVVFGFLLACFA